MSHFLKSFNHKWELNFVKSFFCIYWDDHMVFIFQFVNMVYHIDRFAYIEDKLGINPGINSTGSCYMIFLMPCWFLSVGILLKIFPSIFISDIGLYFSFFCDVFVWFWCQGDVCFVEWVWKCLFIWNFL